VTAIFSSDLKRALWTGQQVQMQQSRQPSPPFTTSELLREQHWGDAEGQPWTAHVPSGAGTDGKKYWVLPPGRNGKFPNGESAEDVAVRTGEAFDTFVLPFVMAAKGKSLGEIHIVMTSHGIAIAELIGAIFQRAANGQGKEPSSWRGLVNTGWTRLVLGLEVCAYKCTRYADLTSNEDLG